MTVIVTGGTGFIGANVTRKFIDEGYDVCALDVKARDVDFLQDKRCWKFFKGDITDLRSLERTIKTENPEGIVHAGVFQDFADIFKTFEVNVKGTAYVLEAARRYDLKAIILSSASVYGQLEGKGPIRENQQFGPTYPLREYDSTWAPEYCTSKRMMEEWSKLLVDLHGLDVTSLRLAWVYGRGPSNYQLNQGPNFLLRKALAGEAFEIPYGRDTFCDLVYVKDVCEAIFKAFRMHKCRSFLYNIAYEKGYFMREVCETISKLIPGSRISLGPGIWPSKGVPYPRGAISWPGTRHMDISLAKDELNYRPAYDLERGFNDYITWMRSNWSVCSFDAVPFSIAVS